MCFLKTVTSLRPKENNTAKILDISQLFFNTLCSKHSLRVTCNLLSILAQNARTTSRKLSN